MNEVRNVIIKQIPIYSMLLKIAKEMDQEDNIEHYSGLIKKLNKMLFMIDAVFDDTKQLK